ncbi:MULTISPECIES: hypothetical protein [Bacillus]|nr:MULTISPECIES: hypothetical protein [Bacillus]MEB9880447.1 hypothetical protein [Bacillus cereus]
MTNKDVTAKGMDLTKSDLKNFDLQATDLKYGKFYYSNLKATEL